MISLGIPPAFAVANEANNILATSVSGSTTHWLKNTLDYKMGLIIVIGGSIGTALGIFTFTYFKGIGKIDTVISLAYMYILAIIGTLMLVESLREIDQAKRNVFFKKKAHVHYWIHGLPLRMRFPKSKLYESIFTPIIIGLIVGFIAAIMGIGGAFILVPAVIYIIKMPLNLIPWKYSFSMRLIVCWIWALSMILRKSLMPYPKTVKTCFSQQLFHRRLETSLRVWLIIPLKYQSAREIPRLSQLNSGFVQ